MRLRNGKQYLTPEIISKEAEEKTRDEMTKIHIPRLNELLYVINKNMAPDKKALAVCEIYQYIYNNFGEFVALQNISRYSTLLHLFSFNLPMKWADLSEKATLHCAFSMRNGVNEKRCKKNSYPYSTTYRTDKARRYNETISRVY